MTDTELINRIGLDPKIMVGKPVIKGTRITVEHILNLLGHGATFQEILGEYDGIQTEDIQACLLFANRALQDIEFVPINSESTCCD